MSFSEMENWINLLHNILSSIKQCVILGFRSSVKEMLALLGCSDW